MVKTKLNDTDEAMKDFDLAIRLEPDNFSAYLGRGLLHRQLKDTEGSLADLNQAIKLAPKCADSSTWRAAGPTPRPA